MRQFLWSAPRKLGILLGAILAIHSPLASAQQPQSAGGGYPTQPYGQGNAAAAPRNALPGGATQQVPNQQPAGQPVASQTPVGQPVQGANPNPGSPIAEPNTNPAAVPGAAMPNEAALRNEPPFPPLSADYQKYLDQVLTTWELHTSKISRYQCTFKRFQYDPTLQKEDPYTVAKGALKYMQPDKGLFRVDELFYNAGRDEANKPQFKTNPTHQFGEYWICDGQYVHMMDRDKKICTKIELPPAMRGNSIYLSPLPFLFGVKANEIKERYWVQPLVPPQGRQNEVWLEAYPKRAEDAANYQRVQVVIDQSDWLPKGLIVFLPNWRANAQHRELYEFENRENLSALANRLNPMNMLKEFIPEKPPADWKTVVEPYQEPAAQPIQGSSEPRVAQPQPAQPLR